MDIGPCQASNEFLKRNWGHWEVTTKWMANKPIKY